MKEMALEMDISRQTKWVGKALSKVTELGGHRVRVGSSLGLKPTREPVMPAPSSTGSGSRLHIISP